LLVASLERNTQMNNRGPILPAVLVVVLGAALPLACRPSQTVERQTKDAAIKAQVKAKLAADVGASTVTAVEVNVTNGVVTLAGPVRSEEERQKAEATARGVEGVSGVNNNLQVNPIESAPPPGSTPPPMGTTPSTTGGGRMAMTPGMAMPPPTPTPY
jgi:hypothetical protein